MHQRQFKSNKKHDSQSSKDSSNDKITPEKKKKRGAPKGHPGWHRRKPDHVDKTIIVAAPDVCPHCSCDELAFYHIDRHRSSQVAQSISGDDFGGVLNADGYAAYNAVNAKNRQTCLAHIIRKAKEIKQEILLKKTKISG